MSSYRRSEEENHASLASVVVRKVGARTVARRLNGYCCFNSYSFHVKRPLREMLCIHFWPCTPKEGAHLNQDLSSGSTAQCLEGSGNYLELSSENWALGCARVCEDSRASLCVLWTVVSIPQNSTQRVHLPVIRMHQAHQSSNGKFLCFWLEVPQLNVATWAHSCCSEALIASYRGLWWIKNGKANYYLWNADCLVDKYLSKFKGIRENNKSNNEKLIRRLEFTDLGATLKT